MGKNEYDMKIRDINVSDFHIILIFNEYYTQIVAILTKPMPNRNRNRRVANPQSQRQESLNATMTYLLRIALQ